MKTALAARGARVTGLDASAEMLRVAKARARERGVEAAFEEGDAHRLPYEDRAFSCAISLRVLMHTPDWRMCLGELCRVADERVSNARHVHADLVRAAGVESTLDECAAGDAFQHRIVRAGFLAAVFDDGHSGALDGMPAQWCIDRPASADFSMHQG